MGALAVRPKAADSPKTLHAVHKLRDEGSTIRGLAAKLKLSTNTVLKVLNAK